MQWGTYCWVALVCIESLWHWNLTLNLDYLKNGKRLWKGVVMFEVTLETFDRGFTPYKGVSNWRACNGTYCWVALVCIESLWHWNLTLNLHYLKNGKRLWKGVVMFEVTLETFDRGFTPYKGVSNWRACNGTYCWVALVCIESLWHWNLTLNLHYLKNGKRLWKGVVMFEVTLETFGRGFTPYKGVSNWRTCNGTYCWVALVCIESLWHWNLTLNLHYLKNGKRLWKGVVMFEVTLETFGRGFTPYKGVSNWRACNGVLIAGSLWYVLRVCDIEIWPWTCII